MTSELSRLERQLMTTSLKDLMKADDEHGVVFLLLDISSSMNSEMRNGKKKIEGLREVVREVKTRGPVQMAVFPPHNSAGAAEFVTSVPHPHGGTPLAQAIEWCKIEGANRLVVVSDGAPDDREGAKEKAKAFGGRIDVVYVGNPGGKGAIFLKELAEMTGGSHFNGDLSTPKELAPRIAGLLGAGVL